MDKSRAPPPLLVPTKEHLEMFMELCKVTERFSTILRELSKTSLGPSALLVLNQQTDLKDSIKVIEEMKRLL
jgi:hypothetical protein